MYFLYDDKNKTPANNRLRCALAQLSANIFFLSLLFVSTQSWADMNRAISWLEAQQDKSDGSWKGSTEAATYMLTAEAIYALKLANQRSPAFYSGKTWLENHDPKNFDLKARKIRALCAHTPCFKGDADILANSVKSRNIPGILFERGWGFSNRYSLSQIDTALVMDALRISERSFYSSAVATYFVVTRKRSNGNVGWSTEYGNGVDPFVTANVVSALSYYRQAEVQTTNIPYPSVESVLNSAVSTLESNVSTASPLHIQTATAIAYLRMNPFSSSATTLLNSLKIQQHANGGFSGGVFTTALAIQAFAIASGEDATSNYINVYVSDQNLRHSINVALGHGALDQINRGEIARITSLDISNLDINSLAGLEHAINLVSLNASKNNIIDLSPIQNLSSLTSVNLNGNPCIGCTQQEVVRDGDVPLPLWSLMLLGVTLMGIISKKKLAS